jgi:hypothetical protein
MYVNLTVTKRTRNKCIRSAETHFSFGQFTHAWRVRFHGCNVMTLTITKGSNSYEINRRETALTHPWKRADRHQTASSTQFEFNPRTATHVDSIAFTSSNTDIGTLLWKISWTNSPLETQRQPRPNWQSFTNEFCVQQIMNKKKLDYNFRYCWRLKSLLPYSVFPISNLRSFNTYLFVSDRIVPAATVKTIEWMG